ncbi:hypothetical protein FJZ18_01070 [Candidatus Pacearchaeota archaeon]|nr:hypothetical protein [Candidatus Pacearchaeota archaeon]
MDHSYFAPRYSYLGPPISDSLEPVPYKDPRTLREKMSDVSSSRSMDLTGSINLMETCAIIFERARELPRLKGKIYVINIENPDKPKLESVDESTILPDNYLTREKVQSQIESSKPVATDSRSKRRGWKGNSFFYKRDTQ